MRDELEKAFLRLRHAADADEYTSMVQVIDVVLARLAEVRGRLVEMHRERNDARDENERLRSEYQAAVEVAVAADSEPIAWYCPRLGVTWRNPRHHAEECWGDYPCLEKLIPVHTPLAVPEETTWGESGGAEAITLHINSVTPWWMVGDNHRASFDHYADMYWIAEHGKSIVVEGDVVDAMNWLARSKK